MILYLIDKFASVLSQNNNRILTETKPYCDVSLLMFVKLFDYIYLHV